MAIKIITDSTCDIDMSIQEALDIDILPLTVHFGEEEYHDGIDISKQEFYSKLRTSKQTPTTSQVTPEAFERLFQKYGEAGHDIIVITIASELSGTYQSANIAKDTIKTANVHLVDSGTTTMGLAWLIHEAIAMRDQGMKAQAILEKLQALKQKVVIYAVIENLEFLKKGGRLSTVSATVGTLLNLKPIIQIKDGVVEVVQKVRGTKKAYKWMLSKALEDKVDVAKHVFFGHTDAPSKLESFMTTAKEHLKATMTKTIEIGITVGTHGGPGCIGIGFVCDTSLSG